jgi:hypothetical protein
VLPRLLAGRDADGFLGLIGVAAPAAGRLFPTFMTAVMNELDLPVFSISYYSNGTYGAGTGLLEMGRIDNEAYSGELQTVNLTNADGSWTSKSISFSANGVSLGDTPWAMVFGQSSNCLLFSE